MLCMVICFRWLGGRVGRRVFHVGGVMRLRVLWFKVLIEGMDRGGGGLVFQGVVVLLGGAPPPTPRG